MRNQSRPRYLYIPLPVSDAAHLVEPDVRIELVHEVAQLLVRAVGVLNPLWIRVDISDEFCEIDDAAEQVGEPVDLLDLHEQVSLCFLRCPGVFILTFWRLLRIRQHPANNRTRSQLRFPRQDLKVLRPLQGRISEPPAAPARAAP